MGLSRDLEFTSPATDCFRNPFALDTHIHITEFPNSYFEPVIFILQSLVKRNGLSPRRVPSERIINDRKIPQPWNGSSRHSSYGQVVIIRFIVVRIFSIESANPLAND